jgi:hypothetical protein
MSLAPGSGGWEELLPRESVSKDVRRQCMVTSTLGAIVVSAIGYANDSYLSIAFTLLDVVAVNSRNITSRCPRKAAVYTADLAYSFLRNCGKRCNPFIRSVLM